MVSTWVGGILENELGQYGITATGNYDWQYDFTVDKKINSKKLIEGIASASPYLPRFNNMGGFIFTEIPMDGNPISPATVQTIKEADCIDFSFSRTKIEDVYTKIEFKYNWDYARGEFNDSVEADIQDFLGEDYKFDYYGLKDDHSESTLVIDDDRGKYIREYATAQYFVDWFLLWSCNQHLKMKIKLPLKYMNLEIGDFVDFDAILGGVKPYGINYIPNNEGWYYEQVNSQQVYKNFLITSTNKTLEFCEIECIQMHDLYSTNFVDTTFEAEESYTVTASSLLDGFMIDNIHTDFPVLENLAFIGSGTYGAATYYEEYGGFWTGVLLGFPIVGGDEYTIRFSQTTTTDLFALND